MNGLVSDFFIAENQILQFMFPALFQTSNKTYKATLKKLVTNIILGSGYNMFLAKNQAISVKCTRA